MIKMNRCYKKAAFLAAMLYLLVSAVAYAGEETAQSAQGVLAADACIKVGTVEILDEPGGTTAAKTVVSNPGAAGANTVTFAALAVNPISGDIHDRKIDVKTNVPSSGDVTFQITGLKKEAGDTVQCYLWDENNRPLANNAPGSVAGLKAEGKVRGVKLSWEAGEDDYDALDHYDIYRDGQKIAVCAGQETTYRDTDIAEGETYRYTVIPVDTDENAGDEAAVSGSRIPVPYYINLTGSNETEINANGYGLCMGYRDDPARAAYTEAATVTDADGDSVSCRFAPRGKYVGIYTDRSIAAETNDVVITFTYLDTVGNLSLIYNMAVPDGQDDSAAYAEKNIPIGAMGGTNTWKEYTVRLTDADFRSSASFFSGCNFGIKATSGDGVYVRRVEMSGLDLYE